MRAEEIIKLLEEQFPPSLAMDWDNSGLQVGSRKTEVKKVLVALDATQKVVDHCVEAGVDLLVTHHPLMLDGLRKVNEDTMYGRKILAMAGAGMVHYAMHTNYDVAKMAELAEHALHLTNCTPLEVTGVDADGHAYGIGSVGELPERMSAKACCAYVKEAFGLTHVQLFGEPDTDVKRMAVCPGSGGKELMKEALKSGADIYLTGDVGHHTGLDAQDQGLTVIDAGHFGIEKIYIGQVMALLRQHFPELLAEAVYQEPFVTL